MRLNQLSILNYKNISDKKFVFEHGITCFVGDNGVGKTSVLDAIYHLCFAKSYNNAIASQNISYGMDFFMIEGHFTTGKKEDTVLCSLKRGQKKILRKNGKPYDKIIDHIGLFPCVMIAPTDRDLICTGSEVRRKFMDGIISQQDMGYLRKLLHYQKLLKQRNALLKFFAKDHTFDATSLEVYDEQLVTCGTDIYLTRLDFIKQFEPIFQHYYQLMSGEKEVVQLDYHSPLSEGDFKELLVYTRPKDQLLQYTTTGIHKDDLKFKIASHPIAKFGSQGQQKSYLIALKLAQFAFIQKKIANTPLLLLDDIFDKLDEKRVTRLLKLVSEEQFKQIFITDTHKERTQKLVTSITKNYTFFKF